MGVSETHQPAAADEHDAFCKGLIHSLVLPDGQNMPNQGQGASPQIF
jgi:hypothetical protein